MSRTFGVGHMCIEFHHAKIDCIIYMDSDLNPPELINKLILNMKKEPT